MKHCLYIAEPKSHHVLFRVKSEKICVIPFLKEKFSSRVISQLSLDLPKKDENVVELKKKVILCGRLMQRLHLMQMNGTHAISIQKTTSRSYIESARFIEGNFTRAWIIRDLSIHLKFNAASSNDILKRVS